MMTLRWSDLSRRGRWGCAVVSAPTDASPPVSCEVFVQHVSHMHDWTETRESGRRLLTSALRFLLPDTCKQEPRCRDNQCIHFTRHCIHSNNKYKWNKKTHWCQQPPPVRRGWPTQRWHQTPNFSLRITQEELQTWTRAARLLLDYVKVSDQVTLVQKSQEAANRLSGEVLMSRGTLINIL